MTVHAPLQPERIPVFSKKTQKLIIRVSEDGVWGWDKVNKEWELFTWEELRAEVETHKNKQAVAI